jgi:hypothetical protein
MLKIFLAFLALAVIVDAVAFGGFYRDTTIGTSIHLLHGLVTLDWNLTHQGQ